MSEFHVPEHLLSPFASGQPGEEGQPQGGESDHLGELVDFGKWITKTADDFARENGYPGTGKVPPDKLGEYLGKMGDKYLPELLKKKTAEATGLTLLGGIFAINYLEYRRRQLEAVQNGEAEISKDKNQGDRFNEG